MYFWHFTHVVVKNGCVRKNFELKFLLETMHLDVSKTIQCAVSVNISWIEEVIVKLRISLYKYTYTIPLSIRQTIAITNLTKLYFSGK